MSITFAEAVELLQGSTSGGYLAIQALLDTVQESELRDIFNKICNTTLIHHRWLSRSNASVALNSLSQKFSSYLKDSLLTESKLLFLQITS